MNGKIGFLLVSIKQQCFSSNLNDVSVFSAKTKGYVTFVISCARPSCSIFVLFSSFLFCSFHSLILLFFPSIVLSFPTSFLSFFFVFLSFYLSSFPLHCLPIYGKMAPIHTYNLYTSTGKYYILP